MSRATVVRIVCGWLAGLLLAIAAADRTFTQQPGATVGQISGTVVDARSGKPVVGAEVFLTRVRIIDGRTVRSTLTKENGGFRFSSVPAGFYDLLVSRSGFVQGAFGAKWAGQAGNAIAVRAGDSYEYLRIDLWRTGALEGTVSHPNGAPAAGWTVDALECDDASSLSQTPSRARGRGTTDSRGSYRLFDLVPGSYALVAYQRRVVPLGEGRTHSGYLKNASGRRRCITVEPGADEIAAIWLEEQPLSRVRGRVVPPAGSSLVDFDLTGFVVRSDEPDYFVVPQQVRIGTDGTFVAAVPPGRFRVVVRAMALHDPKDSRIGLRSLWGASVFTDAEQHVAVALVENHIVGVSLTADGSQSPLAATEVSLVSLRGPFAGIDDRKVSVRVGQSAELGLVPGTYQLSLRFGEKDAIVAWHLRSLRLGHREVQADSFSIDGSMRPNELAVELTTLRASLQGFLMDDDSRPLTDFTVIALAPKASDEHQRVFHVRPATDGSYWFDHLPPTEYLVAVVPSSSRLPLASRDVLAAAATGGISVTVREGVAGRLDLRVARRGLTPYRPRDFSSRSSTTLLSASRD